jgi:hypothetical protein
MEYLSAQDEGYQGSFEEFYWERFGEECPTMAIRKGWEATEQDASVSVRGPAPSQLLTSMRVKVTALSFTPASWSGASRNIQYSVAQPLTAMQVGLHAAKVHAPLSCLAPVPLLL